MEKRTAPRYEIRVPVECQFEAGTATGTTANVSTSGVRIALALASASTRLSVGSGLTMRFSFFVGSFDTPFGASVVRHTDDGFAVQFNALDGRQRDLLRRALPAPDEV